MTTDRQFTHPDVGNQARVEVWGNEVRLIFVCKSVDAAEDVANSILRQLAQGAVNITMMGKPTSIVEEDLDGKN
jgi:hypothetical protein